MTVFGDFSRVNTNVSVLQSLSALENINRELAMHQLRVSTGKRINASMDDPAGFVIGKRLEARSRALTVALYNVGDASGVASIAEGGLNSILNTLMTMKEQVTQAANDTLSTSERDSIENQLDDLATEIDNIVSQTTFDDTALIDGTYTGKSFQIGSEGTDTMTFGISQDARSNALSVADADLDVSSASAASTSLTSVNNAIDLVTSTIRSLGSTQTRLSIQENQLSTLITNTESARSRIFDANMAREQLKVLQLQILQRASTASLVQASLTPRSVLSLFA